MVKFIWKFFKFFKSIDTYFYVNKLGKVLPQLHKVSFVEDNFLVEVVWEEIFDEFYNFSIKYFGYGNYLWLIFSDKLFLHRKFRRDLKIVFMISVWNFWCLLSSAIEFWIISKVFRQRKCSGLVLWRRFEKFCWALYHANGRQKARRLNILGDEIWVSSFQMEVGIVKSNINAFMVSEGAFLS